MSLDGYITGPNDRLERASATVASGCTGHDQPNSKLGATLHVADAGSALPAALTVSSGINNVCRDGERVSNHRFSAATGWPLNDRHCPSPLARARWSEWQRRREKARRRKVRQ